MNACKGKNRLGRPCGKTAVEDGYCRAHHPDPAKRQDMAALGRRGGLVSPETQLRKAADDELRDEARETLRKALRGDDVPKSALDAARSLFSYRADAPPSDTEDRGEYAGPLVDGHRPTSLADVLRVATDLHRRGLAPIPPKLAEAARALTVTAGETPGGSATFPAQKETHDD